MDHAGAPSQLGLGNDLAGAVPMPPPVRPGAAARKRISEAYGRLPLRFEANRGQADPRVKFLSRGSGQTLFLTSTEAVLTLEGSRGDAPDLSRRPLPDFGARADQRAHAVLRMKLAGANPAPQIAGREELPGRSNYLLGNDPTRWRTDIPTYGRVAYREVYPGVDLAYHGNPAVAGQLEYDFVVSPGADPRRIRLSVSGAESLEVEKSGDLVLRSGGKEVRFLKPVVYQTADSGRREIASRYVLRGRQEVGFEVAAYDPSRPLVIDPVLAYSTYFGGTGNEESRAIAVDAAGNAYIAGSVAPAQLPTFPPTPPIFVNSDAFVINLDPTGTVVLYSTYLGGSDYDAAEAIAVDSEGSAYITGITASTDYPTVDPFWGSAGAFDAFVSKLSPNGKNLVYSSYLGGSGTDVGFGIVVDSAGSAYVAGMTSSTGMITRNPLQANNAGSYDAFVAKLIPEGTDLVYCTYFGATEEDGAYGIAVDPTGNAYITGVTYSTDFPTLNPLQTATGGAPDAFVAELNADGSALVYSTYLGASGHDYGNGIAVDSAGSAYITGSTNSAATIFANTTNFPTASPLQATKAGGYDAFVTKLNAGGSALVYSTYLGGSGDDYSYGIALDGNGNAFITGFTTSTNFPTANAVQAANAGAADAFVAGLNATGSALIYSTYLGGSGNDYGYAIAVDSAGSAYVTGVTQSSDFPTFNPLQAANGGNTDAFVAKIMQPAVPVINAGGVVSAATFGAQVAAGGIASLFGTGVATATAGATILPLPTSLAGSSVSVNGLATPLFFVSSGQINFQIPWQAQGQGQISVAVTATGGTSDTVSLPLAAYAPGIFSVDSSGSGQGVIQVANTVLLAAPAGSIPGMQARPAFPGESVSIYCTGLGPVSNTPASGAAAGASPLSTTTTTPTVMIGGIGAVVSFSGLTPGLVGLYQVNVQVPYSAPLGSSVPVTLTIGGVASNTVTMAVQ
jgi:uncharacterized protein (TIGR03437 family)